MQIRRVDDETRHEIEGAVAAVSARPRAGTAAVSSASPKTPN
jgi:hypothetical protein